MKRYNIALAIIALALLFGCCPCEEEQKAPDTTLYPSDSYEWHKEEWNGHVYVIWKYSYHMGGMTHDPDCHCHKEAKKEEHVYENPNQD